MRALFKKLKDNKAKPIFTEQKGEPGLFIGVHIDFAKASVVVIDEKHEGNKDELCKSAVISIPRVFRNKNKSMQLGDLPKTWTTHRELSNDLLAKNIREKITTHIKKQYERRWIKGIVVGYFGSKLTALETTISASWPELTSRKAFHCAPIADIYFDLLFVKKSEKEKTEKNAFDVVGILYSGATSWMVTETKCTDEQTPNLRKCRLDRLFENGSAYGIGKNILDYHFDAFNRPVANDVLQEGIRRNLRNHFGFDNMFDVVSFLKQDDEIMEKLASFAFESAEETINAPENVLANIVRNAFDDASRFIRKRYLNDLNIFGSNALKFNIFLCGEVAQCHALFHFKRESDRVHPESLWRSDIGLSNPAFAAGFYAFKRCRMVKPYTFGDDMWNT